MSHAEMVPVIHPIRFLNEPETIADNASTRPPNSDRQTEIIHPDVPISFAYFN